MERRIFAILNLHVNTLLIDDEHLNDLPEQLLFGIDIVEDGTTAHTRGLLYVAKADPIISVKDEQAERSTKQFSSSLWLFLIISLAICLQRYIIYFIYASLCLKTLNYSLKTPIGRFCY